MHSSIESPFHNEQLRSAIVVGVHEDFCTIVLGNQFARARYATHFPTPRVERLSPGHLVAVGAAPDGGDVVVWRWYDAVVVDSTGGELVAMWEPAHGNVLAHRRLLHRKLQPGTRAYLSAGLPGADWWVTGPTTAHGEAADVELGEVERFYTDNDLWSTVI